MELEYNTACNAYDNEDYKTAFTLFHKLAVDGDVSSQVNIANMLLHGLGVKQDEKKAYECYSQAAENGDAQAQYYYGWNCVENSKEQEGIKYLSLASEANYADATHDLAGFYAYGMYGLDIDLTKAIVLYEKSLLLGKEDSRNALMYTKTERDGKFKTMIYFMKNIFRFAKAIKP